MPLGKWNCFFFTIHFYKKTQQKHSEAHNPPFFPLVTPVLLFVPQFLLTARFPRKHIAFRLSRYYFHIPFSSYRLRLILRHFPTINFSVPKCPASSNANRYFAPVALHDIFISPVISTSAPRKAALLIKCWLAPPQTAALQMIFANLPPGARLANLAFGPHAFASSASVISRDSNPMRPKTALTFIG